MKRILSYQKPWFDRLTYAVEQLLAFYLFFGGISTASSPAINGTNAIAVALGSHAGLVAMGFTFMVVGVLLLISRIIDNDKLHGYTLMAIYAIMTFTVFIEILLGTNFADSLSLSVISGLLYLRAKRLEPWRGKHKR